MLVTQYKHIKQTKGGIDRKMIDVLLAIRDGEWEEKTNSYRETAYEYGKRSPEAREAKSKMPYFTGSGSFKERNDNGLQFHSGFIIVDVDDLEDSEFEEAKKIISQDKYTYAVFTSVGGSGLAVCVRVDPELHYESFEAIDAYYKKRYSIKIDYLPDISRPRYVSFDPDIYINEDSEIFTPDSIPEEYRPENKFPNGEEVEFMIPIVDGEPNEKKLIEIAFEIVSQNHTYETGNKHRFISNVACVCNRFGVDVLALEGYVEERYPEFKTYKGNAISGPYNTYKSQAGKPYEKERQALVKNGFLGNGEVMNGHAYLLQNKGVLSHGNGHTEQPLYESPPPTEEQKQELLKDILARELDFKNPIEEPTPIISVGDGILSTAGNITVITGQSKVGKSGCIAGMLSGAMAVPGKGADTLGFNVVTNLDGKAIIHIDTEQSRYHADRNFRNIIRRAKRDNRPVWYRSFWFTDYGAKKLLEYTKLIVAHCAEQHKGVHMIVIDGIGDYVESVNDDKESNFIVAEFMRIAQEYDCPIITVLHFNPGTEKERGHIGSQLQRKAESIIKIEKDKASDISTIRYKELRNASRLPELEFRWDDEQGMHAFLGHAVKSEQDRREREQLKKTVAKVFKELPFMTSKEINRTIQALENIGERKAYDLMKRMKIHSLILLRHDKTYERSII